MSLLIKRNLSSTNTNATILSIEFRIPVQVSILSERRVYHPYGLAGGSDASCGLNIWVRKVEVTDPSRSDRLLNGEDSTDYSLEIKPVLEERRINMGGKNTAAMQAGERYVLFSCCDKN